MNFNLHPPLDIKKFEDIAVACYVDKDSCNISRDASPHVMRYNVRYVNFLNFDFSELLA